MPLRTALRETLEGWQADIDPHWRDVVGDVDLAFDDVDPALELEPWEPIFPARRGRTSPVHRWARTCCAPSTISRLRTCGAWSWVRTPIPARLRLRPGLRGRQRRALAGARQDVLPQRACGHPAHRDRTDGGSPFRPELFSMASDTGGYRGRRGRAGSAGRPCRSLGRVGRIAAQLLAHALSLPARRRSASGARASAALAAVDGPRARPSCGEESAGGRHRLRRCGGGTLSAADLSKSDAGDAVRVILRPHPAAADEILPQENPFTLCNRRLKTMGAPPVDW